LAPNLSGRIPELDGLRGIAIGLVWFGHYFLLHGGTPPGTLVAYALVPFRLHWTGVDLFFVLSGFLIGGILLDARDSSNYFKVFYTRRFFRILPLYIVCLGATLLLYGLTQAGLGGRLAWMWMWEKPVPWFSYPLFLQNFWMSLRTTPGVYPLSVTWSLAVEEQFYLTLPLLVRFLNRKALLAVLSAGIVLAPVIRTALYFAWPGHFLSWFMLTPCRADALLLGTVGAIAMRDARCRTWLASRQSLFNFVLLPVLLLGLAFYILRGYNQFVFPMLSLGFSWIAVFYLCVLLYALLWPASWIAACLRWRWLRWLGVIAYAAYLFHVLVLSVLHSLFWSWSRFPIATSFSQWAVTFASIAVTLLLCRFSWIYFEKPLIRLGHRSHYNFANSVPQERPQPAPEPVRP
jgi:peptidoglycan/LPS O-acetylase OafA/YrhL